MKFDVADDRALYNLDIANVRRYLESSGWTCKDRQEKFDVFEDESKEVIIVPNSMAYGDYGYRMEEMISVVSKIRGESLQTIISEMTMSSAADIIEYHYEPDSGEMGLIPIDDLEKILEAGKNINYYAYKDLKQYQQFHSGSKVEGKKALNGVRIGVGAPGSYVVRFMYPRTTASSFYSEPCASIYPELCNKIETSIRMVIEAAEKGMTELDPKLEISYNFISSVSALKFESAKVYINRAGDTESKPMTITANTAKNIAKIAEHMKPEGSDKCTTLFGRIVQVTDHRAEKEEGSAKMTLKYLDDENCAKAASFSVSGRDLDTAYEAMVKRKTVSLTGLLTGIGKIKRLEDVSDIKILDRSAGLGVHKYVNGVNYLMAKTTLKIEGMMCEGCVKSVKESLEKVPGVKGVDVNLKKGTATVQQDGVSDEALIKAVVDAGFRASVRHGLF